MARLSNVPHRAPEEGDAQSPSEEEGTSSTSSTRDQNHPRAMTRNNNTSTAHTGAMGQTESREALKTRNRAIHEASRQATNPNNTRPGKLQRLSGQPQRANGRRMLQQNPLSNPDTFKVPVDSDEGTARRTRQPVASQPFSPLKRNPRQQSRILEEDSLQRKLDGQLNGDYAGEQVEADSGSGESLRIRPDDVQEDGSDAVASDPDARYRDHFPDRLLRSAENAEKSIGLFVGADSPDELEIDSEAQEAASEEQQSSSGSKRKHGRPSRQSQRNVRARPSTQPEPNHQGHQKRGRPTRPANGSSHLADADTASTKRAVQAAPRKSPRKPVNTQSSAPSTPHRSLRSTANRDNATTNRRTRPAQEQPARNSTNQIGDAATHQPARRQKQSSVRAQTAMSGNTGSSRVQIRTNSGEELSGVHGSQLVQPDAEDPAVDHHNDQEQPQDGNDDNSDDVKDEDESGDNGDQEYDGNAEEAEDQTELSIEDRQRLYGHWNKVHSMRREVARHRGSTNSIKDESFKKAVQDCDELRSRIRGITADISAEELQQNMDECGKIINQARAICGNEAVHRKRNRGFHVFKHLIPALARLFEAVVEAFERVDIESSTNRQLSLIHLGAVLELLRAITECEHFAYHNYQGLNKPIKGDVHCNIALPLRDLLTALEKEHRRLALEEERRERNDMIARDIASREDLRMERAQRKALVTRNQEKWKAMNSVRLYISRNTGLMWKMNHLRSCPMTLVETAADGRPFLPNYLRPRAGEWTEEELQALISSLRRNADIADPLRSTVFERVMEEQCHHGRQLADKNLLEIVLMANEQLGNWTEWCAENGVELEEWVERIPVWTEMV